MTLKTLIRVGLAGVAALAVTALFADPTWAENAAPAAAALSEMPLAQAAAAAAEPTVNKGDNAWMLTSTVLVLLMTIPGLALFYAGMVRPKNALSVLTHVFYTVCIVTLIWAVYGYSLTFTEGNAYFGGFDRLFLKGTFDAAKDPQFSMAATFSSTSRYRLSSRR